MNFCTRGRHRQHPDHHRGLSDHESWVRRGAGLVPGPDSQGYTEVASDGGLFDFGSPFYGSMGGQPLNSPMVGGTQVTGHPATGRSLPMGSLLLRGCRLLRLNRWHAPERADRRHGVTPDGLGYWLVASDGGIFASTAMLATTDLEEARRLNQPIVGMAATPDGKGYWLVAADGGILLLR